MSPKPIILKLIIVLSLIVSLFFLGKFFTGEEQWKVTFLLIAYFAMTFVWIYTLIIIYIQSRQIKQLKKEISTPKPLTKDEVNAEVDEVLK